MRRGARVDREHGALALDIDVFQFRLDLVRQRSDIGRLVGLFDRLIGGKPVLDAVKAGGAQFQRVKQFVGLGDRSACDEGQRPVQPLVRPQEKRP